MRRKRDKIEGCPRTTTARQIQICRAKDQLLVTSTKQVDETTRGVQVTTNLGELVFVHWNLSQVARVTVFVFNIQIRPLLTILMVIVGSKNETISGDS